MENNLCDCTPLNPNLVDKVKKEMPDFNMVLDLSDFFKVFGDSTRLQLLVALQNQELCVSDLANVLNRKKSIISHQLKTLRMSKLVKAKKKSVVLFFIH